MKKEHFILPLLLFLAFLLRLPSLFEPNWYGDEGIYQVIGQAIREGRLLYTGIWDNKPPLLYVIYAIFNGDQFLVRLSSLIAMLFTILAFYHLAKTLFSHKKVIYVITGLFALLFATPFLEGNIANAENFMLLPIVVAIYLALVSRYFVAGFLLGIAFLIKSVAIFDVATLLVFIFTMAFPKDIKKWFFTSTLLAAGFIIPAIFTFLFFLFNGAISDFITAAFSQNVSYVGAGNKLIIGQGLLLPKLTLLATVSLFLFLQRQKLAKEYLFIYVWLAFSLFNAFFGGRPWIHYLLTLLPAFCLFVGMIMENQKLRVAHSMLALGILFLVYKNFWIYGKIFSYYPNFVAYAIGAKSDRDYYDFFDWFVNRDYKIAEYLAANAKKDDTVFLWGDNAQIYAIAKRLPPGRYVVSYHVTFYQDAAVETKEAIARGKPLFIVAIRDDFPKLLLDANYTFEAAIEGAKIYKREKL